MQTKIGLTTFFFIYIYKIQMFQKRKIKRKRKKILKRQRSKKYGQNTKRNFFCNIARLVINFLNCQEKSSLCLSKLIPNLDSGIKKQFYKYIKKFKRNIETYIKRSTFYNLFGIQQIRVKSEGMQQIQSYFKFKQQFREKDAKIRQLARILAKYYLEQQAVPIILRSKRMNSQNRGEHLVLRRQLILAFESIRQLPADTNIIHQ